jgi:hypothetical protein
MLSTTNTTNTTDVVRLWCHIYHKHHKHPYKGLFVVWYVVWCFVGVVFIKLMMNGLEAKDERKTEPSGSGQKSHTMSRF